MFKHLIFFLILLSSSLEAAGTRVISHAMGNTRVPAEPKRVVVLDAGALDAALLVNVLPVGSVDVFSSGMVPVYLETYLKGRKKEIENVGLLAQPNLEEIMLLKPDLILSHAVRHKSLYPQLSRIAPTVIADAAIGAGWRENFMLYTEALGRKATGEALLATYQEKANALGIKFSQRGAMPTISIVRFFASQETRIYREETFIGTILASVGLPFPYNTAFKGKGILFVNEESIPAMDAGYLFYSFYADPREGRRPSEGDRKDFFANPLWRNLSVNKRNHSFKVNDDHWMTGTGLAAALKVLEDLERLLLPSERPS